MRVFALAGLLVVSAVASAQSGILKDPKAERESAFWKSIGQGYQGTWRAASKLKAGAPVDDLQASLLAAAYFYAHISGCGGPGSAKDKGGYWLLESRWGYAWSPGPAIVVDK